MREYNRGSIEERRLAEQPTQHTKRAHKINEANKRKEKNTLNAKRNIPSVFLPDKKNERLSCSLSRNKQKQETSKSDNDQEEREHHGRFYIRPVILLGIFLAVAATSFYAGVIIRTLMISHHSGSELKLNSFKQAEMIIISKQLPPANANMDIRLNL